MAAFFSAFTLLVVLLLPAVVEAQASVSSTTILLPTYLEGLPNANPQFDRLKPDWLSSFYPYTWRTSFTDKKVDHGWRAVTLENEYLKCTFLPDLGGRLYNCIDKLNGKDMFYANRCVRKNWVALRGAFAALGVEFNFPVGHSWVNVSPVDFATRHKEDGSASVIISSVDRVTGMQWRVEATLLPGVDYLEQKVTLYNRSNVRSRYSWWTDAAIRMEDDSTTFVMPTSHTFTHEVESADTWPINSAGINMSIAGNHKNQTSLFASGSREPFLAVYQPTSRTGTIHYADPVQMPGKKIWCWGSNPENGNAWVRKNLSDDGSTYVEIQAGTFQDQETFEFLEPQQSRSFTEYWLPARDLGGISRANLSAAVNLQSSKEAEGKSGLTVEMQAYRRIPNADLKILDGHQVLLNETVNLTPAANLTRTLHDLPPAHSYRVELSDQRGAILLAHTAGAISSLTASSHRAAKHTALDANHATSESEFLQIAEHDELNGKLQSADADYQIALSKFPISVALLKAEGRVLVEINRPAAAAKDLTQAQSKLPDDPEIHYHLGLAYLDQTLEQKAFAEFSAVSAKSQFAHSAAVQLAAMAARSKDWDGALQRLRKVSADSGDRTRAGAMEVAFLRHAGRLKEAKSRLAYWQSVDPSDLFLRFEAVQLGSPDAELFRQLAADPERVLNIVTELFEFGMFEDSLALTDYNYSAFDSLDTEPGAVLPQYYPLVAYYRGFARQRLGQPSFAADYRAASNMSTLYVFPSRPGSLAVLQAAVAQEPNDATAHALLGCLYFYLSKYDEAIAEWQKARATRKDLPALHRNLGRALLEIKSDPIGAAEVLKEGLALNPNDVEMAEALRKAQTQK